MRKIAIVNLKGGVGKTVTAVNVAAILVDSCACRVLVIDADPQSNATRFLGLDGSRTEKNMATVMAGGGGDPFSYVYETRIPRVDMVPSDISLIEADIASVSSGGGAMLLTQLLNAIEADDPGAYGYCVIDCPPSFTAASVAAIAAADDVIIPVKIDAFALSGMRELMAQIDGVRNIRPSIRIAGVLVTMWHRSPAVIQGEELLRTAGLPVFSTHIRRSDKVDESTFAGEALGCYSSRSAAARDYRAFVAEYLEGCANG